MQIILVYVYMFISFDIMFVIDKKKRIYNKTLFNVHAQPLLDVKKRRKRFTCLLRRNQYADNQW